jgi:hypothetical protein
MLGLPVALLHVGFLDAIAAAWAAPCSSASWPPASP